MRSILFIVIHFFVFFSYGQEEITLAGFSNSECEKGVDVYSIKTRIINQWYKQDTLNIEVGLRATCCIDFAPSVSFSNDTLHLDFEETGGSCDCDCCYQLTYQLTGLDRIPENVTLRGREIQYSQEKYITYPVSFEIYEGDTINYKDKYGHKQGLFILGKDKQRPFIKMIYKDNVPVNGSRMIWYYEEGQVKSEEAFVDGKRLDREYYRNGQLKSECRDQRAILTESQSIMGKFCHEWDNLGNKTQDMDCCLFDEQDKNTTEIIIINHLSIYVDRTHEIGANELDKLKSLLDPSKTIVICYEETAYRGFLSEVLEIIKSNESLRFIIDSFKIRRFD